MLTDQTGDGMSRTTTGPIFVGGTGRSGTTIIAKLIGQSSRYAFIPVEARLHTDVGGLRDLLYGQVSIQSFADAVMTRWYWREPSKNGPRGLHVVLDRTTMEQALARLEAHLPRDPLSACGQFLRDIFDPFAVHSGKPSWVEMTPPTADSMAFLARILPDARFIHMTRDGRRVAASVVRRHWGPDDMASALDWWVNRMIKIARAESQVPNERRLRLDLESLVGPQRKDAYERLSSFIGLPGDNGMLEFFESSIRVSKTHPDHWRKSLNAAEIKQIDSQYSVALARLADAGVDLPGIDVL